MSSEPIVQAAPDRAGHWIGDATLVMVAAPSAIHSRPPSKRVTAGDDRKARRKHVRTGVRLPFAHRPSSGGRRNPT
jgi:hypothetical protein